MIPRRPAFLRFAPWLTAALLLPGLAAARGTITGVCPDGSMFIVKRSSDIPCSNSLEVEPSDVPPIKPEYLPRPYGWQRFQEKQDPNNPYNLVEAARKVREAWQRSADELPQVGAGPAPSQATPPSPQPQPQPAPVRTAMVRPAPTPTPAEDLGLSNKQIRDLFLIVELAQRRTPAAFEPDGGAPVMLRLARSRSFDARLREAHTTLRGGSVLLFSAVAEAASSFHANLTFVQGHEAFQPSSGNRAELGILHGRLGELERDGSILGYLVLPAHLDPAQPMDIYWNDRRITATLQAP